WWTIDGGGVTFAAGGGFNLGGTVGQPDASNALTGGSFNLTGGFWFAPACIATNGDVDGNNCVDDADLLGVLFNFGATGANLADVNCDAAVDDADLLIVLFNFGTGCGDPERGCKRMPIGVSNAVVASPPTPLPPRGRGESDAPSPRGGRRGGRG
ncbi:MAG: hypothetical protein NZM10_02725, partial [Fimbriimonadales bacterium]|nr:hypothetical protein [Fimbriimonadales bacterium]